MGETVDAVIIGAGPNGLVAANVLADAGWDVVVVEGTEHIGGAVRSAEMTAPGYLSDVCSAFYPLGAASPVLQQLDLEAHGLEWTHAPAVVTHVLADGRAATLSRDLDRTAGSLESFAAGDGDRWIRAYEDWCDITDALVPALLSPFPPVRAGARLAARLGAAGGLRLTRRLMLPTRALGRELFRGEGGRVLLAGLALHTDLSPDEAGSGAFGWLLAMLGQQFGFPVPVGGAQRITDALAKRFGGAIITGTPVTKVVVANNAALGVLAADGRRWRARRAVLADVPAPTLYRELVGADRLPRQVLEDLDGFHWDHGTLKVDYALSAPLDWIAPEAARAGTVHLGADVDGLAKYAYELATNRAPSEPFLLLGQMTTADPTRSPAGTESLWVYTHVPHGGFDVAEQAKRVEDVIERHAPGFRDRIVARHVAGPDDLERENLSLVGGAINGGSAAVFQQLVLRPIPGLGRADTPIDRLYLAGSGAHPGGGVHGAAGANAARAALARNRPVLGSLYGSAIRSANRRLYPR